MSEVNAPNDGKATRPSVVSIDVAVEYITNALTNGELVMKTACKELGWSFPRIRSRALTIAKKMNSAFKKTSRGVYILEPFETPENTSEATGKNSGTVESAATITDDQTKDDQTKDDQTKDEPTLNADEVEKVLLDNTTNISNTPNA